MNSRRGADATVVSFDNEPLILVDHQDNQIGQLSKSDAHCGIGRLHRAFSLFVFDDRRRLLIQRRAASKRLWPGYWSNTCCSHPRNGEDMTTATSRRLEQELGIRCDMEFLFKFEYQAQYDVDGAENELCWVFLGSSNAQPRLNPSEISEVRYVAACDLDVEMAQQPEKFTPWFKLEWSRVRRNLIEDRDAPNKNFAPGIMRMPASL